jgi:tetratricopeptide (TPR) repeat protein
LSARFTQHGGGHSERRDAREADPPVVERQQAVLLEMLRRAAGAPVSYAQLQDAGIEFPASVVSELELAGVSVERCDVHERGGRRLAGVRLDPRREQSEIPGQQSEIPTQPPASALRDARTSVARLRQALGERVAKLSLPAAALLAAGRVVIVLVLVVSSGGGRALNVAATHRKQRPAVSAAARSHVPAASERGSAAGPQARPTPRATPTPVSPALAVQLDAHGHEMLEQGRYGEAIALLERTLTASGENLQDCRQPASETCLTYAYALYDLGRALRLDGDASAAVPVLRRRLQIENQRPTVQAKLELALARTG